MSNGVARGSRWTLEQRFQGWDGIAHGGILATILDEVMAWALVGEDNWGLTARLSIDFKCPVRVGQAIRAEGWITRSRRRIVDTAAQATDAATGEVLATATGVYVAADEERKRATAPAVRLAFARRGPRPIPPRRWTAASEPGHADRGRQQPGHRASRRVRRRSQAALPRRSGTASPSTSTTRTPSRRPCTRASRSSPIRSTSRVSTSSPRARPDPGCPLAAPRRRDPRLPPGDPPRSSDIVAVPRRSPLSRGAPRGALVRLRAARADARWRRGTDLAAPASRCARGGRLDHGRRPGPPIRCRHRRGVVSLGRARAARVLPVPLGTPARRIDDRDDDPWQPPDRSWSRGRRPRAADPRPADRRRRAGRPEGAVVGVPLARADRSRPDDPGAPG